MITDTLGAVRAARPFLVPTVVVTLGTLLSACAVTTSADTAPAPSITRPAAPEGELPAELQSELQAALDETMKENDVPGAVAGVWIPGQGSWTSATGIADLESGEPVTTEMSWPLRSITKSYTVTLILQLADEGKLDLDDTIGEYFEGVTNGDEITLRQLADMSSGNSDYFTQGFIDAFTTDDAKIFTLDELNGYVVDQPEKFAPGTQREYTNANTNLLGAVVEKVTGQDFTDALNERILEPLGQTSTHYLTDVATWTDAHATGYQPDDDGVFEPQTENLSIFGPAGSMVSTLEDSRVWGDTLGSGSLLTPATQTERQQGGQIASPPYDIYAMGIGETNGWWGHNGEGAGFTAAVFHNPDSGATVAVFMNNARLESGAHPSDQMFRKVTAIVDAEASK